MGYYGLLVPQTAIAKDATGSKWDQGLTYLGNFAAPYALWLPLVLLIALAAVLSVARDCLLRCATAAGFSGGCKAPARWSASCWSVGWCKPLLDSAGRRLHARAGVVGPGVLPAGPNRSDPDRRGPAVHKTGSWFTREKGNLLGGAVAALWLALAGWALWAANSPGMGRDATRVTYSGIVDERRFYSQATGHAHPLTAADYLDYPRMRAVLVAINNTPDGALLLPSGNYDVWDVVPALPLRRRRRRGLDGRLASSSRATPSSSPTSECSA